MSDRPFQIEVPEEELAELRRRIAATNWPEKETVTDQSQGVPLAMIQKLARHWMTDYDWRTCEARLNALTQFLTETDPTTHGGSAADAFHVVIPSMPGYGFSGKPTSTGWGPERMARAWAEPMHRLGYRRYVAQGGDWGRSWSTRWACRHRRACLASTPAWRPPSAAVAAALDRTTSTTGELTRDEILDNRPSLGGGDIAGAPPMRDCGAVRLVKGDSHERIFHPTAHPRRPRLGLRGAEPPRRVHRHLHQPLHRHR